MNSAAWIASTLAYALVAATPGPTTLLVLSYGLAHGHRTARPVVTGTGLGAATCLAAALFGIGAVLAASVTAFSILQIAGAIYLIYLGVRLWRAAPLLCDETSPARCSLSAAFVQAWLTTAFNPASAIFFTIFVPQFINPQAALTPQFAVMVLTVLACRAAVDGSYSLFASHLRRFIRTHRAQRVTNGISGSLLVGEGIVAAALPMLAP